LHHHWGVDELHSAFFWRDGALVARPVGVGARPDALLFLLDLYRERLLTVANTARHLHATAKKSVISLIVIESAGVVKLRRALGFFCAQLMRLKKF